MKSKKELVKRDIISACIALIVLDALFAPLLRALISTPYDAAFVVFRFSAIALATINALIILVTIHQIRSIK